MDRKRFSEKDVVAHRMSMAADRSRAAVRQAFEAIQEVGVHHGTYPSVDQTVVEAMRALSTAIEKVDDVRSLTSLLLAGRREISTTMKLVMEMTLDGRLVMYRGHPSWTARRMTGRRLETGYIALSNKQREALTELQTMGLVDGPFEDGSPAKVKS